MRHCPFRAARVSRVRHGLAVAIIAALAAGTVHAQDATDATDLDRIVVTAPNYVPAGSMTATKSGAPLIETPQSISVVTRDQIDLLGFTDVQQAIRYTSGIVGENYGPDLRFDFLTLRGFTPKQYLDGLQAPVTTTTSGKPVSVSRVKITPDEPMSERTIFCTPTLSSTCS